MASDEIDSLVSAFSACQLPKAEWTHLAHLKVGVWFVQQYGRAEGLARLRDGIRRLNDSHQTVNSAVSGYHETITRAYVELIAQLLDTCPSTMPHSDRVGRIVGSALSDPATLLRFYSRDRLMSAAARADWVEPDLAPLSAAAVDR